MVMLGLVLPVVVVVVMVVVPVGRHRRRVRGTIRLLFRLGIREVHGLE
jgi:hypothetical protein